MLKLNPGVQSNHDAGESAGEVPEAIETATEEEGDGDAVLGTAEAKSSDDPTAAGYDEAVEAGVPFRAEPEILAENSADPVALTEVEAFSEDEILLQEPGRDLRPDTIVPAPDISAAEAAAIENLEAVAAEEIVASEDATAEATEATEETEKSAPAVLEDTASGESTDEEKQDASQNDAEN